MADPADIQRLLGDLARLGTVTAVDRAAGTCRVRVGEIETGELPWLAFRAGATRVWSPPSIGEQVLLICPEADAAAGLVLGALSSDAHPAPADDESTLAAFIDGARIGYDPVAHTLSASLPAGATVSIQAQGGIRLLGDVAIEGDLTCSGTVTADVDVVGGGKSLKGHKHLAVQPGSGVSGAPQ
jgi:phage baseplate assembly protein V